MRWGPAGSRTPCRRTRCGSTLIRDVVGDGRGCGRSRASSRSRSARHRHSDVRSLVRGADRAHERQRECERPDPGFRAPLSAAAVNWPRRPTTVAGPRCARDDATARLAPSPCRGITRSGDAVTGSRVEHSEMAQASGWPALFSSAFQQSRNAMMLRQRAPADRRRQRGLYAAPRPPRRRVAAPAGLGARRRRPARHRARMARADRDPAVQRRGPAPPRRRERGAGPVGRHGRDRHGSPARAVRRAQHVALGLLASGAPRKRSPSRPLSAREREIVRLVALGATGPEIADELRITHDTVRTHVRNAMVRSRALVRARTSWPRPSAPTCSRNESAQLR